MSTPPSGRDGPHIFVPDLDTLEVDSDDRHHLARVLRLRPGDPLTAGDGAGAWRPCRFGDRLEATGPVIVVPPNPFRLTVGFAIIKGGRPELIVQKLTELGIDDIVPFIAERSVVRWDDEKRAANRRRWQRVAREAAMQSRQVWLPDIEPVGEIGAAAARPGATLAERGGPAPSEAVRTILIGPEGGWSDAERSIAPHVGLPGGVLRAETAAIVAGTILAARRGSDRAADLDG
ncbi:MAG: 16S rRNA (uracil(1498)-N(3))-methyltransferase [Acidimicrobiia bacterium]|nr:16S rRNA (uracil(1498)-N(3))-methyltransferase [Acidimicrobiia bacterium]